MNTSINNSTAKFLESFIKLGEFFEDALNNCLNENYNDVKTAIKNTYLIIIMM